MAAATVRGRSKAPHPQRAHGRRPLYASLRRTYVGTYAGPSRRAHRPHPLLHRPGLAQLPCHRVLGVGEFHAHAALACTPSTCRGTWSSNFAIRAQCGRPASTAAGRIPVGRQLQRTSVSDTGSLSTSPHANSPPRRRRPCPSHPAAPGSDRHASIENSLGKEGMISNERRFVILNDVKDLLLKS